MSPTATLLGALFAVTASAQELRRGGVIVNHFAGFDAVRGRVIVAANGNHSREWDGNVWRLAPDLGALRAFPYCDAAGRVVQLVDSLPGAPALLDYRLRRRTGASWQDITPAGGPGLRWAAGVVHDPVQDRLVLFGGFDPQLGQFGTDTWTFDGTAWQPLPSPQNPPGRQLTSLAYDLARQRVVMFGGYDGSPRSDTWELTAGGWQPVATTATPTARYGAGLAYDVARQRTVLVGGSGFVPISDPHWEYDGQDWLPMPPLPANVQAGLPGAIAVHDAARGETLLIGGQDSVGPHGSVFAWNGATWSPRAGLGRSPAWYVVAPATGAAPGAVLRFGGRIESNYVPNAEFWQWNGDWNLMATTGPAPRSHGILWWQQGGVFTFGGVDELTQQAFGDTWRWNGAAWSQLAVGAAPSARWGAAVAYDALADRAVLFGGCTSLPPTFTLSAQTWLFDGANWQSVVTSPSPSPRVGHGMAYDPLRGRVVLFGGNQVLTDTWEWNGLAWQQVVTVHAPPPATSLAFDVTLGRIVGVAMVASLPSLWTYDGVDWTQLPAVGVAGSTAPLLVGDPRAVTMPSGRFGFVDPYGITELMTTPARVQHYGSDCGAQAPTFGAASLPRVPDPSFALDVVGAPPNGLVAIAGDVASAVIPLAGCTLLVAPIATALLTASPTGHAMLPMAIPAQPTLVGASVFFQAGTLVPANPNGFALSAGVRVDLGQ
jgi:hypothetical protein